MLLPPENNKIIIGVDEAGLGPLAFDVVAAATIMNFDYDSDDEFVDQINDSKKLKENKRNELANYIKDNAFAYGIGIATIEEIDRYNILQARFMAMHRAIDNLLLVINERYNMTVNDIDLIQVDGDKFKPYFYNDINIPHECCIKGDAIYLNIASASILAKTFRDNMVDDIVKINPELDTKYGFSKNKGYGTVTHMNGLKQYGICDFHRKSYEPVKKIIKLFQ